MEARGIRCLIRFLFFAKPSMMKQIAAEFQQTKSISDF